MSLVIQKLDENNINKYFDVILRTIEEQQETTIPNINDYKEYFTSYCLNYMYILTFNTNGKHKLLGYLSISRWDLNKTSGIFRFMVDYVLGNVYIFDVYVFPKYRMIGVGKYMIKKAVETAIRNYNSASIYLYTKTFALARFYQKNKFYLHSHVQLNNQSLLLLKRTISNYEKNLYK